MSSILDISKQMLIIRSFILLGIGGTCGIGGRKIIMSSKLAWVPSDFEASLNYIWRPYLKNKIKTIKTSLIVFEKEP